VLRSLEPNDIKPGDDRIICGNMLATFGFINSTKWWQLFASKTLQSEILSGRFLVATFTIPGKPEHDWMLVTVLVGGQLYRHMA